MQNYKETLDNLTKQVFKEIGREVTKEDGKTFPAIYDSLGIFMPGTRFEMRIPKDILAEITHGTRLKLAYESAIVLDVMEEPSYGILYCETTNDN